ncbi:MAG: hypothetical protein O2983_15650 [Planctomycetota bacterium]|nr:hypothetical protein [Planctomycetota bacterium]MDA0919061.1 hypothetical protein [Planctomycetota bacterium]MDA1161040.1 hypothetical protein [Planctomycetota bacterium]
MQETNHNANVTTTPVEVDTHPIGESSLRKMARQISKRTTDLLAISIVGIGVLTVSGRLAEWWHTDSTTVATPAASAQQSAGSAIRWGFGESNVSILIGNQTVRMERKVIFGDQDRVDSILKDRLISMLETETSPTASSSGESPVEHERRILDLLKTLTPIESREGRWSIYRLDQTDNPLPGSFLMATRSTGTPSISESLAAWAIATPSGPQQWTSFLLTPAGADHSAGPHATPVPNDGKLLMSLRTDSHEELTVFQRLDARRSDISRWTHDISMKLTTAGWHQTRSWQQSANSTAARFERPMAATRHPHQAMELTLSFFESGRLTGTSNVIALPTQERAPFDAADDHTP